MAGRKFGVDPGTMNLRICQLGRGLIVNEKNLVAVQKKNVINAGDQAYEMFERTPAAIKVSRPVSSGVIADTAYLGREVEILLKKNAIAPAFLRSFHFYIAVPSDISEVEKRAYYNLILQSVFNTRHVFLVDKPIACAIGENLSFSGDDPVMIVDMGAGSTEVSILMKGGLTVSCLLKEGGLTINETIISSVRRQFGLEIGEKTAEKLKFELGDAIPDSRSSVQAFGRSLVTGLPGSAQIPVNLVFEAMKTYFIHVVQTIHNMIGKVPPQQAQAIMNRGIFFTGGTSMIPKLGELFESILHVKVNFSASPSDSAIRGVAKIMQNPSAYRKILYTVRDSSFE